MSTLNNAVSQQPTNTHSEQHYRNSTTSNKIPQQIAANKSSICNKEQRTKNKEQTTNNKQLQLTSKNMKQLESQ
jgi:hypothetical protein